MSSVVLSIYICFIRNVAVGNEGNEYEKDFF